MGNWCCPAALPCDSVEERSGLLQQDVSKPAAHAAEPGVVGAFQDSPEEEADVRKTSDEAKIPEEEMVVTDQVKPSPRAGEMEPAKSQENGPIQDEYRQTEEPSPGLRGDPDIIAQDRNVNSTTDNGPFESPQRTLESPQTTDPRGSTEINISAETKEAVVEELPAAAQDRTPDGVSQQADEGPPENLTIRAELQTEQVTPETVRDDEDDGSKAADRPSEDSCLCDEVSSLPDSQLPAEVCQGSNSVSGHETSMESSLTLQTPSSSSSVSPSSAVIQDLDSGNGSDEKEPSPEDLLVQSHDTPEPSPGSEPPLHNGAETPSPPAASESLNPDEHSKGGLQSTPIGLSEVTEEEFRVKGEEFRVKGEDNDVPKVVEEKEAETEGETLELKDKDKLVARASAEEEVVSVREQQEITEEDTGESDEDLYRGTEELTSNQGGEAGPVPLSEITLPKVEDRCSLSPAVDILSYSEREWRGHTAKSVLIRKGYKEMSQRFGSLRRVRGDNYCALRATLFQLLSHSTRLPAWLQQEDDITMLPKELEAREGLISQWTFPGECQQGDGAGDATEQLKRYMELLRNRWQVAVGCSSAEERQHLCERVFQGGEEELGLLEALKLLMLGRAVELHASMRAGGDVPVFCWLLFARDSSECPRTFLSNHLSRVGFSGGLEQVEMFLLGYALQCTIQVYRLYMADTEEFVTYYPDDHKDDWPSVCLVTEDDRHYNVPVGEAAALPVGDASS